MRVDKIKSGIYGLNPLLDGGINENSTTVVIGSSGAGKTTFGLQFIMRGMEVGDDGVFISLDENQKQIIKEAKAMGWTYINDFIENEQLVFIDASGEQFSKFINKELPDFVNDWKGTKSRIVIDPLTPVLWATTERYQQRELISFLFKQARKVGTVLATLEEHGQAGNLSGPETVIPMYMADCVIHLRYSTISEKVDRELKIVKCRSSKHSELTHPYRIIGGLGLAVHHTISWNKPIKKIPEKKLAEYKKLLGSLPKEAKVRVNRALSMLSEEDLKDIKASKLVKDVLREYK